MAPDKPDADGVHRRLQNLIGGGEAHSLVNVLPQVLQRVIEHDVWKTRTKADGQPFASLGEYLTAWFPFGAGCEQTRTAISYSQLMELCQGFPSVHSVLAKNMPKGKPGRKKVGEIGAARLQFNSRHGNASNRTPVLQAKLAERFPEVWAEFLAGKYKTVRAAATAAGLVKDGHSPLPRLKQYWKKASAAERKEFLAFIKG